MAFGTLIRRIAYPLAGILIAVAAYRAYGWMGVAAVVTGLVMWLLLHFTRTMQVLQRAAQRPVGHVDSAVMLNAKLQVGYSLLHVVAMTRALGSRQSAADTQPELFRWSDAGGSWVDCVFVQGKLSRWSLVRPEVGAGTIDAP